MRRPVIPASHSVRTSQYLAVAPAPSLLNAKSLSYQSNSEHRHTSPGNTRQLRRNDRVGHAARVILHKESLGICPLDIRHGAPVWRGSIQRSYTPPCGDGATTHSGQSGVVAVRRTLQRHEFKITGLAAGPGLKVLASVSDDRTIKLWTCIATLNPDQGAINGIALSQDGRVLVSAGADGTPILVGVMRSTRISLLLTFPLGIRGRV